MLIAIFILGIFFACYQHFSSDVLNEEMTKKDRIQLETYVQHITNRENVCVKCVSNLRIYDELYSLLKNQKPQIQQENISRSIRCLTNCLSILNLILAYVTCEKSRSIYFVLTMIFLEIMGSFYINNPTQMFYLHSIVFITSILLFFFSVYLVVRCTLD